MANLCIIGSHHINAVSELHTQILRNSIFHVFYQIDPNQILNITNGISPRRWLLQCNPCMFIKYIISIDLSTVITKKLGTKEWIINLELLSVLREFAMDEDFQLEWEEARIENKKRLIQYIEQTQGISIPQHFLFDVMIKRFHEYKRQLLNAMYCIYRYQWIKSLSIEQRQQVVPRAFLFGGKVEIEKMK